MSSIVKLSNLHESRFKNIREISEIDRDEKVWPDQEVCKLCCVNET